MGSKLSVALFCCFLVISPALMAGISGVYHFRAEDNTYHYDLKPWNHMYGRAAPGYNYYYPGQYPSINYNCVGALYFSGRSSKPLYLKLTAVVDGTETVGGEKIVQTAIIYDEFVIPANRAVDTELISQSYFVLSAKLEVTELIPISGKGTTTIYFGPGAGVTSTLFINTKEFFNIPLAPNRFTGFEIPDYTTTFYNPTGDKPSGVTASSTETVIPTSVTSSFSLVYSATDNLISPERVYTTVNYIYKPLDPENPPPATNPKPPNIPPPGSTVVLPDGTVATVMNESGDVILPDGTIYGFKSPKNPFYNPAIDQKTPTITEAKPTEATETTTTRPEYTGEDADTGAIVNALGDVGQGFTESVNNLSKDVTNGLNGLGEGNIEGFNNVVRSITDLSNDLNINAQKDREATDKIVDSLEKIGESLAGEDGQEPDDVIISEETIDAPSLTGVLSSIAGLNIAPASPPVLNVSLPRLGGLSPQILTLDFASIPFLHYFPLVRSILAWSLIIFTFKHIFQIFTIGG